MPFSRYVEIGRVALVNYGEDYGKLVVITDVVDQNRALVDAPGIVRRTENFKRLAITDYKLDIPRLAKKTAVEAGLKDVEAKFRQSAWGRKLAKRALKRSMTDFDRYKATKATITKNKKVREALEKLQKSSK